MALKEKHVGGDFYSCFPLEEHFQHLESKNIHDIKFGKIGGAEEYLYRYSKFEYERRTRFFEQKGKSTIKDDVLQWLRTKADEAVSGDAVNVFFLCHGSRTSLVLGDHKLFPAEIIPAMRAFRAEVQVNFVTSACYGGTFADWVRLDGQYYRYVETAAQATEVAYTVTRSVSNRFRNTRFTQAFCRSLARATLPGVLPRTPWRIVDHENFMMEQMLRKITPGASISHPTSYQGAPTNFQTVVETMMFRDHVDVVRDPQTTARRRRIEWPSANPRLIELFQQSNAASSTNSGAVPRAEDVIRQQVEKCSIANTPYVDMTVVEEFCFTKTPNISNLLKALYFRARLQSTVWDVFEQLEMRGFVKFESLYQPVDLFNAGSTTVRNIFGILQCFTWCIEMEQKWGQDQQIGGFVGHFDHHLHWLAVIIVRSSADISTLLETIVRMGYLGDIDESRLETQKELMRGPVFNSPMKCDPDECVPTSSKTQTIWGFWLPHQSTTSDPQGLARTVRESFAIFNKIEAAFKELFELPDEVVLLEQDQARYYEAHPDQLPE